MMGNRRLNKIVCFYTIDTSESERVKVTALNLFHPTASPLVQKSVYSYCDTTSYDGGRLGWGWTSRNFAPHLSPPPPWRLCHNGMNAVIVILNEVKNLIISTKSIIEILRLMPQDDIATQSLGGGSYFF